LLLLLLLPLFPLNFIPALSFFFSLTIEINLMPIYLLKASKARTTKTELCAVVVVVDDLLSSRMAGVHYVGIYEIVNVYNYSDYCQPPFASEKCHKNIKQKR